MDARTAAIATVIALSVCHLSVRRHAGWATGSATSSTARFYLFTGYPAVAIAVFWLTQATSASTWEWGAGTTWALTAAVLLIRGFDLMNQAAEQQPRSRPMQANRISLHTQPGRR